jgi:hypothetical protein
VIQEVRADNTEIWRWTMSDYFDPASSTFPINFESTPGFAGTGWDVFHINAIDRVESDGDYIVTARHVDGVFRVDHPSGDVLWTLGTPMARNVQPAGPVAPQLTIIGDPYNGPKRPHDARLVGDVLTILDNQAGMPGRQSRAVAYRIDEVALTATLLWEIRNNSPFTGDTLGSAQLTGDSVLVNWGAGLQPLIEEYTTNGTRLMSIGLPGGGNSYRTLKYPTADFDANTLRANTGGAAVTSPP